MVPSVENNGVFNVWGPTTGRNDAITTAVVEEKTSLQFSKENRGKREYIITV